MLLFREYVMAGTHDISSHLRQFIESNRLRDDSFFLSPLSIDNLHYYSVDQALISVEIEPSPARLTPVPEPSGLTLLGGGLLACLAGLRRASRRVHLRRDTSGEGA